MAEPDLRKNDAFRGSTTPSCGLPGGLGTPDFRSGTGISVSTDYYHGLLVLLGQKITFWCKLVLWDHASPRQAHKRSASRHIWRAWRPPRGTKTGMHL